MIDHICGIDRYAHSIERGKLVVPIALLWNKAKAEVKEDNLSGALAHGSEVMVLKERIVSKQPFSLVRETNPPEGQEPQEGWLRNTLLENAGLKEYGQKAIEERDD
jgi:hypothetical protein